MDNYLQTCLSNHDVFVLLENLVIDLSGVFEYITKPSLYIMDIDLIAYIKEEGEALKKKHRCKIITVQDCEWILFNENISTCKSLPESTLYMDTKQLSSGKEYIYNKQQNYVLLPIRTSGGKLLWLLQVYRNDTKKIKHSVLKLDSHFVLLKGELNLFQVFLWLLGSHLDTLLHQRVLEIK